MPSIYLGYGAEDAFATAQGLLRDMLPRDHVFTTSGGHTPETMKKLWCIFLEKELLK